MKCITVTLFEYFMQLIVHSTSRGLGKTLQVLLHILFCFITYPFLVLQTISLVWTLLSKPPYHLMSQLADSVPGNQNKIRLQVLGQ
jgi:hypothetical protein